jgi:hypothetical protein
MPDSQGGRLDLTPQSANEEKPYSPEMEVFIQLLGRLLAARWRKISGNGRVVETERVRELFVPDAAPR